MLASAIREKRMISFGKWTAAALLGAAALAAPPALSHHSFAMFDVQQEVTLSGTVREFQWTNPHSWLQVDVARGGSTVEYSIELGSPNSMSRRGWRRTTFKPGDKITLVMNPMRDGSAGGALVHATDPQGKRWAWR
jgi:hypothetical protein